MEVPAEKGAFVARVRKAAPTGLWSLGVKWARDGAVGGLVSGTSEVTARVRERGRAVPATVTLYLADDEWVCDCEGKADVCAHVVATTIAWSTQPAASTSPDERHTLRYDLVLEHGSLVLIRTFVASSGTETKLVRPLADQVAARELPPGFDPTHDDLTVDRVMQRRVVGDIPAGELGRVFGALESATVTLGGAAVEVRGEPIRPTATLIERSEGSTFVELTPGRGVKVVALGVGSLDGVLRPLAETRELGLRWERLPERREFDRAARGELLTRVLPELEKRYVVLRGEHLRDTDVRKVELRVAFQVTHHDRSMEVLPTLVYGDPPLARVDPSGALVLAGNAVVVRNEAKERELSRRLRDELSLAVGRRASFEGLDAAAMAERLLHFRDGTGFSRAKVSMAPRAAERDGRVDVWFETDDGREVSMEAAFEAYRAGLDLVGVGGGGFAELPRALLEKHVDVIAALVAAKKEGAEAALRAATLVARPLFEDLAPRLVTEAEAFRALGAVDDASAEGAKVDAELRPYQRDGVRFLVTRRKAGLGALLADDMGLGKTLQMIAALEGRCLVVCPRSVMHNWSAEIERFRPGLATVRYEGANRKLPEGPGVVLTTYAILRIDADLLAKERFDVVVLDEAQAIKNADSLVARAAHRLDAGFRVAMTGTPIENRLDDLHSLMTFAVPGLLGRRNDFRERYTSEAGVDVGRLRRLLAPFLLRRTKDEVLSDLPPKTDATILVELDEEERVVYDAILAANRSEIVAELSKGKASLAVLELLLRLRQAACHVGLVPGQTRTSSSKVDVLADALEEIRDEGHRALVFSQWTSLLDRVEPALAARGVTFGRLDGGTRDRKAVVDAFQAPDGPTALLLSLKAGGAGINLTAADHVFLLDPWWNPAVERQAEDRAHRIGQTRPVIVHRMVAKDTIEEGIVRMLAQKRELAEQVLGEGEFALPIGRDDILALIAAPGG